MTIQTRTLEGAQHDWFATRSGMPTAAPTTEHMAAYFGSKGFGGNASIRKPLSQMEEEWLNSLTGVTGTDNYSDKWLEAVAGQSITPAKSLDQNKYLFFTGVASSP